MLLVEKILLRKNDFDLLLMNFSYDNADKQAMRIYGPIIGQSNLKIANLVSLSHLFPV
jgi:hypothetical protein